MNTNAPLRHGPCARPRAHRATVLSLATVLAAAIAWGSLPGRARGDVSTSWHDAIASNEPVIFSVTGDVPYGTSEIALFQEQIDEHNVFSPSELFFHVGDILAGSESCTESRYRTMRDILRTSEVPAYIVPGDNETTDCSNPSQGWLWWVEYLMGLETSWSCRPSTTRQSGRQENFAFVHKGVLFVGIHLVGGTNSSSIMQDDADWVSQQLQQNGSQVRGAVVVSQAGPGGNRDAFFNPFVSAAQSFGKPILFIHGDGHSWKQDKPFSSAQNVTRVQVEQGGNELPVQVTATLSTSSMFQFVRDPWANNPQPVTRPPCGSSSPTLAISDVSLDEGNAGTVAANFTVTLANPNGQSVSVQYATANGTASAGSDYASNSGTLAFSGSTTSQSVAVTVHGDVDVESDEVFYVDLSNPSNAVIVDSRGQGTIRNDDAANTVPVAVDDSYSTPVSTALSVPAPGVLGNDSDANGDPLTAEPASQPSNGSLSLSTNGGFVYTPSSGWTGTDQFTYRARDAASASAAATVRITVGTPATATFAPAADAYVRSSSANGNYGGSSELRIKTSSTTYRSYLKFVLAGIASFDSAKLRFYVTDATSSAGTIHAVSNSYAGSATPWVENGITWNNAPPMTSPPLASMDRVASGTWIEFDVTAAITGDGTYSFGWQSQSSNSGRYSSKEGANPPQLVLQVSGPGPGPGPENAPPVAANDSYGLNEDATLTVAAPGVLGNDTDADDPALGAQVTVAPSHGTLTLQSDGGFTYTPQADYNGADAFTYRASDGRGGTDTADVTLAVAAVPDAPVATAESYAVQAGASLDVPAPGVLDNDADADGEALSAVLVQGVSHGTLALNSNGAFTYTPAPGHSGVDSFTYRASDGALQSAETMVTLNTGGGGGGGGAVTFAGALTGGVSAAASVSSSGSFDASPGDLFLAAIASKPYRTVTGVTGLGLSWTRVRAQCAGRNQTGVEIWLARGTVGSGNATASLESAVENAVIAVARYAGAHATTPLGAVISGNSNGIDGACDGGVDGAAFAMNLGSQSGATVFGAVAMRARTLTPGSGWTKQAELLQGSGGGVAGVAVADGGPVSGAVSFAGSFEKAVDWAAIGIEIRPAVTVTKVEARTQATFSGLVRVFPNPATEFTSVAYELQGSTAVEIVIYNARGQRVRSLARGQAPAGRQLLVWDTRDESGLRVPAGVYFLRARLGAHAVQQKVVIQR